MYKLTIRAQTKSKAKLVGKLLNVKHFIVGRKYDINFVVKNIGDTPSPPVNIKYKVNWPHSPASTTSNFDVKPLGPQSPHESDTETYMALSTGLATIMGNAYTPKPQNKKIRLWSMEYEKYLKSTEACGTIYSTTPEAIYTYWALWLSAAGLFLAAFDWSLYRFLCLSALGLIFLAFKINCSKTQILQLIFSFFISGYLGQFSYLMSILRVMEDTIRAGYLRSAPYISEYDKIYGIKWKVHFSLGVPIQYHILMIAAISFMIWSFYTLYKVATRIRSENTERKSTQSRGIFRWTVNSLINISFIVCAAITIFVFKVYNKLWAEYAISAFATFIGAYFAFNFNIVLDRVRRRERRDKLLRDIYIELKQNSSWLVGKGHILNTGVWDSGKSTDLIQLLDSEELDGLSEVYHQIELNVYEAKICRQAAEKHRILPAGPEKVAAHKNWVQLSQLLHTREPDLKKQIDDFLKKDFWEKVGN